MGKTDIVHHKIDVGDHPPIKSTPYRVPYSQGCIISQQVKPMLENNIIKPSNSPWSSNVVLVKKKNESQRFCIDFRKLNSITKQENYPLPCIDETIRFSSSTRYSCDYGIGGVLAQIDKNSNERTISDASRALSKAERKYFPTERECLAIVYCVKYFRPYVYGRHFTISTDHNLSPGFNLSNIHVIVYYVGL